MSDHETKADKTQQTTSSSAAKTATPSSPASPTPGPREQSEHYPTLIYGLLDGDTSRFIADYADMHGCDTAEDSANARLIAAAPELLEACESCLSAFDKADTLPRAYAENWAELRAAADQTRAVIAKAVSNDEEVRS